MTEVTQEAVPPREIATNHGNWEPWRELNGGTLVATFQRLLTFYGERASPEPGVTVFSCDYNGWTDMREEEREALEALENPPQFATPATVALWVWIPQPRPQPSPFRKAA